MEEYLAAEADGKGNDKALREKENKEYEDDLDG
jgi:hypothetical protein